MTSAANSSREEWLKTTGVVQATLHGRNVEFRYPDSVYMRNVVFMIFDGQEYPILTLPNYAPTVIVDVGANVGASIYYFHSVYPGARIFGYEPSQENFRCLAENVRPFADKIQVYPYGLLDRDMEAPLYRGTDQAGQNSIVQSRETSAAPAEHVRIVNAAREIAERGWHEVSILKLDTEGCEVPILTAFLAAVPTIDILYCEYHSDDDRQKIDELLKGRFLLCNSKATKAHLGTTVYAARSLVSRYPHLAQGSKSFLDASRSH